MNDITFHIGLTKAGSTFLQDFFTWHDDIHYPERFTLTNSLSDPLDLDFDFKKAELIIQKYLEEAKNKKNTFIYSHERLSGNPHSGFFNAKNIADRIKMLTPNAKIIIVIREQYSLISSIYKQYVSIGGTKNFTQYLFGANDGRLPLFNPLFLKYESLINYYKEKFNDEHVKIILFEELIKDPKTIFNEILNFVGSHEIDNIPQNILLPKNVSMDENQIDLLRSKNVVSNITPSFKDPIFLRSSNNRNSLNHLKSSLEPNNFLKEHSLLIEANKLLPDLYSKSNTRLSQILNKRLNDYGYI